MQLHLRINRMSHYYCDNTEHAVGEVICDDTFHTIKHDPHNYKCLTIRGGRIEKKTDRVIFSAGSRWAISWKETMSVLVEGELTVDVTYEVKGWSTP